MVRRGRTAKPQASADGERDNCDNKEERGRLHHLGSIVWPPVVDGAVEVKN